MSTLKGLLTFLVALAELSGFDASAAQGPDSNLAQALAAARVRNLPQAPISAAIVRPLDRALASAPTANLRASGAAGAYWDGHDFQFSRTSGTSSLSADTQTGKLIYSVALDIPPGRPGQTPTLALAYDSDVGAASELGLGWRLNVPEIERVSTVKAGTRYFALDETGGDELVSIDSSNINFQRKGNPYWGTFHRLTDASGNKFWRASSSDGREAIYGRSPEASRVPRNPSSRARWYLETVAENETPIVRYSYAKADEQVRLTTIGYTSRGAASAQCSSTSGSIGCNFVHTLEFSWETAVDAGRGFDDGYPWCDCHRLKAIDAFVNGEAARHWNIEYVQESPSSPPSWYRSRALLRTITENSALPGSTESRTVALFEYTSEGSPQAETWPESPSPLAPLGSLLADIDADGRTDVASIWDGYPVWIAWLSRGHDWNTVAKVDERLWPPGPSGQYSLTVLWNGVVPRFICRFRGADSSAILMETE